MKHKGFNVDKLMDRLDIEIRNAKIVVSWDVMGNMTKLSYKQKVHALMEEYHLSYSRVEDIIQENFGEEQD